MNSASLSTFAHHDKLPKLPIPPLELACKNYLRVLKPLQTPEEHAATSEAVANFIADAGPVLDAQLRQYAKHRPSFIEQFWYDSYLTFDNPVVLNLNPFFLIEDDQTPAASCQVSRAAALTTSALRFVRALRREELTPDTAKDGSPLCMFQYSKLFGSARVPTSSGCLMHSDIAARHIVVLCQSQFYWFDVLDDNSDLIMSERDLAVNLEAILADAESIAEKTPEDLARQSFGVLTTESRAVWASLRDKIDMEAATNPGDETCARNAENLSVVDSALFIVCLDKESPTDLSELCRNMLCGLSRTENGIQTGSCTNRWYDKLQLIITKNAKAGVNFEHTGVDGHTVLRFVSDIYTDSILRFAKSINGKTHSIWASTSPDPSQRDPASFGDVSTTPRRLEWNITPEISLSIRFAETRLGDLICQNEFQCLEFDGYGSEFIKQMGYSPDAFLQMGFQAAYYALYGRVECTYEPAITKKFYHGRTESVRTVSEESVDFVRTFCDRGSPAAKLDSLRRACARHTATTKECMNGMGQDRYLYALLCVWKRVSDDYYRSMYRGDGDRYGFGGVFSWKPRIDGYEDALSDDSSSDVSSYSGDSLLESQELQTRTNSEVSNPQDDFTDDFAEKLTAQLNHEKNQAAKADALALQRIAGEIPPLFADEGWDKLNNSILCTSNCGNPALKLFGFGPTSAAGFGLGYIIKEDTISVCASSRHRQTRRFLDTLEWYFNEVKSLWTEINSRKLDVNKGEENYLLGGYGYFDVGESLPSHGGSGTATPTPYAPSRDIIGRKLRFAEY